MSPETRHRFARLLLVGSVVLWVACRVAYGLGWLSPQALDSITNDLSWFAITLTAADLLATSDVRVQQEDESP